MSKTAILGMPEIMQNQTQKEAAANTALQLLETSANAATTHDLSAASVTCTSIKFTRFFLHRLQNHTTERTFTVPASKRLFCVKNETTYDVTVEVTGGDSVLVGGEQTAIIASDGETPMVIAYTTALNDTFLSLTDTPDDYTTHAGKYLRVNMAGTGIEFITASGLVTSGPDTETEYETTNPTTPGTGLRLFARKRAGRSNLGVLTSTGSSYEIQRSLSHGDFFLVRAGGTTNNLTTVGTSVQHQWSTSGTAIPTAHAADYTTLGRSMRGTGPSVYGRGNNSYSRMYVNSPFFYRGDGSDPAGGFEYCVRFTSSISSGMRAYIGLLGAPLGSSAATFSSTTQPSTLRAGSVILYKDTTDLSWRLGWGDASGNLSSVSLGSDFAVDSARSTVIEFSLSCEKNGNIHWSVHDLDSNDYQSGTISTNLPPTDYYMWASQAVAITTNGFTNVNDGGIFIGSLYGARDF